MSMNNSEQPSAEKSARDFEASTAVTNIPERRSSHEEIEKTSLLLQMWIRWCKFYMNNDFLILVLCAILLAKAYPPLGADYLQPQITSTWIAVVFIFRKFLSLNQWKLQLFLVVSKLSTVYRAFFF
jgi:hypothetical protein